VPAYTTTPGLLTVVTCISMVWGDVTLSDLDAWVQTADLTKLTRVSINGGSSYWKVNGGTLLSYGRWVLEDVDTLACQTADGTVDFYASGFLLTEP